MHRRLDHTNQSPAIALRTITKRPGLLIGLLLSCFLYLPSCNEIERTKTDAFYAEPVPPRRQEFRWSNGKAPKSLDPALAAAPPETDIVRAIYDGLTDLDPKTLKEVPALAEKWASSDNDVA